MRRLTVLTFAVALLGLASASPFGSAEAGAAANPWPHTAVSGFANPDRQIYFPDRSAYYIVYADGVVTSSPNGVKRGDASGLGLARPMVGGAIAADGKGYWLVASDGGLFSYGSAHFYGSMGAAHLNQPVFSMASTVSGKGYWLVARDGGIFTFGDAHFYGSTGAIKLNQPIAGITTGPSGKGYRMVARDGGIFTFGDAPYYGGLPSLGLHVTDVVGMAPTPSKKGYWIAERNGHVHAFGDAQSFGNYVPDPLMSCDHPVGIFSNPANQGYRLVLETGASISFGAIIDTFWGSPSVHFCNPLNPGPGHL